MLNNNFFKSRIFLLLRRDHQADGPAFESSSNLFFYFPIQKYFTILFKILEFLRSLDRFTVHTRVLLVSFIWLGEKNSLKYLLIGGGTFVPPCPDGVDIAYVQTGLKFFNGRKSSKIRVCIQLDAACRSLVKN